MLCPMKLINADMLTYLDKREEVLKCETLNCAWWDRIHNCCAVKDISLKK